MSYFSLIYLGLFSLTISVLSFFNIIYSYYFNLYLNQNSYIYSLILSLIFGLIFLIKKKDNYKITIYHKILTVISGYFILPLIISIPFYFSIYNISFLDSYFEAISGFTSTGFTIFYNIKHLDESLILWRSSSQWIGGLYFLFSIILLIDIFDNNLKKSLTNFLSFNTSETLKQSSKILILYTLLTFFIFVILKIFDLRSLDSFNLAMTLISSGGFIPVNNLSSIINTNTKEIVFSLTMLVSFFSIFLILIIIGGSFFSTSSGIRLIKLYALFKFAINNLISHVKPKNIFLNKHFFLNINFEKDEIFRYFLSVLIFIISLFILTSFLTISGISLESSFKLSILTLMNTVNSSMHGLSDFNFQELQFFTKYYLIFFMIIGRVELLTLLIICKKFLFKS